MNNAIKIVSFNILVSCIVLGCAACAFAGESGTHHAYRVTSYNLGPILDFHSKRTIFEAEDFSPLMIASTTSDVLSNEFQPSVSGVEADPLTTQSTGLAIAAQVDATSKISLEGAFGITNHLWAPERVGYENESSWEANLGLIYRLVDNLSYEIHFGYMDTGNLFTDQASYSDVESIIMVSNKISMSF